MQKINIVCVGKLKEKFFSDAVNEYLKRLSRFASVTVRELAEKRTLREEAENILKELRGACVVLAVEGKKLSSETFAEKMKRFADEGKEVTFVIGSSCGLSESVKARADLLLSFSDMTFPHQLMRVILCEQIYRAFMINGGGEYHK
ncbi:MAG TPA: 23S rRNA (pseudouridine(1915)-N(3))-methyltransferase RlmH [Candidatus Borkfalkia avistercoris]|uniref:Ribosomal RNA large subunit methyltransferase H n=1 Tax=Candidatus Borkfalkia avistercoris TaxID=2838504 RepID=A0A9D2CXZ3_9FIRM|nr:23S rRNA (pseudouridine(1915)-N(3))-methyltransferase RlmH [Candidatus Borkfalkia avistercoris]